MGLDSKKVYVILILFLVFLVSSAVTSKRPFDGDDSLMPYDGSRPYDDRPRPFDGGPRPYDDGPRPFDRPGRRGRPDMDDRDDDYDDDNDDDDEDERDRSDDRSSRNDFPSRKSSRPPFDMSYFTKKSNQFFTALCTAKDRCVTNCNSDFQDGCVCYNDGSCSQQAVNRCHQCTDPSVFAVFEGSACPRPEFPMTCSRMKRHRNTRKRRSNIRGDPNLLVICTGEKQRSCVCDMDDQCTLKMMDICDACQTENFKAIFLNSTCPDTSLQADCSSTEGILPKATCNNPQAYQCQQQDRTSMECNLTSSSKACVCYSNGTCLNQPASACACQNPDIVSVYTKGYCPANCTSNATTGAGTEESEEGESKNEEQEEGESKNEEQQEEEQEESSEGTAKPIIPPNATANNSATNQTPAIVPNQTNNTMNNISDEFTPKNSQRFADCSNSNPYFCAENDRASTNCTEGLSTSCICNKEGICINIPTNRCRACAISEVTSIFENGSCTNFCKSSIDTNNVKTALTAPSLPSNNTQSALPIQTPQDQSGAVLTPQAQ